jgi:hypothetical protein
MKVYQIISESRLTPFLDVLERLGSANMDQALGFLARLVGRNRLTAKEIAESWVTASKKTGWPLEDVIMMGERQLVTEGVDRAIIDAAIQEAAKFKPGLLGRITKKLTATNKSLDVTKSIFGDSFDSIAAVMYKLALYQPFVMCGYHIAKDYYSFKSGQMTEAVFRQSAQYWLNQCVGEIAAVVAGNAVLSVAWAIPGGIGIGSFKPLAGLAQGLNKASQTALNGWLLTPAGGEWLGKLIVGDTFGKINDEPSLKFIRDMMGGWVTEGLKIGKNEVQKYTNPAAAAEYDKKAKEKDAAAQAEWDKIPSTSKGYEYDQYGMPKRNF